MKNICTAAPFVCLSLIWSPRLIGQQTWSLKIKPSLNFPVSRAVTSANGYGFDLTVGYPIDLRFIAEAGWGQNIFPAKKNSGNSEGFDEQRFLVGFQFFWSLKNKRLSLMTGSDAVFSHFEFEHPDGLSKSSKRDIGWRINVGPSYVFAERVNITPSVSYTNTALKEGDFDSGSSLRYLSLNIEIAYFLRDRNLPMREKDEL